LCMYYNTINISSTKEEFNNLILIRVVGDCVREAPSTRPKVDTFILHYTINTVWYIHAQLDIDAVRLLDKRRTDLADHGLDGLAGAHVVEHVAVVIHDVDHALRVSA
jgi:hypothetical protein